MELLLSVTGEAEAGSAGEQPAEEWPVGDSLLWTGTDRNWPVPATRRLPSHHLLKHRSRSPDPSKNPLGHRAMVARLAGWQFRYVTKYKGAAGSGRNHGSTVAWCPPLRRQTRRLEVVWRSLPRHVPALLTRRVAGLLRLDLLQYG